MKNIAEIVRLTSENLRLINPCLDNLIDSFSLAHLEKLVADCRTYFFIAQMGDLNVGYSLTYKFPSLNSNSNLSYLYDIEVLESYRRQGIGQSLIAKLLIALKNDGVTEMWLGTAIDNVAGQALFRSTGAKKSDEIFHDYTYIL